MGRLEGPEKRHHPHGKDASVPSHEMPKKEHWEKSYNPYPPGTNTPAGAFAPKRSKDRPTVYPKVNESDH